MEKMDPMSRLTIDSDQEKKGNSFQRRSSILNLLGIGTSASNSDKTYENITIHLLDGRKISVQFEDKLTGYKLINKIAYELGNQEKAKYFGLLTETKDEVPEWIDLHNPISKEVSEHSVDAFILRIKFYPADPVSELVPDTFARLLYHQLRHDLAVGLLIGKQKDRCALVAYSAQYEEEIENISKEKLSFCEIRKNSNVFPGIDESMRNEIKSFLIENHQITRNDALTEFLKLATKMETYGIEPFLAKDQRGNGICIGFNYKGLSVFKSSQQVNFFRWENLITFECLRKTLIITINNQDLRKKIGFKFDTRSEAQNFLNRVSEASCFFSHNCKGTPENFKKSKLFSSSSVDSTDRGSTSASTFFCQLIFHDRAAAVRPIVQLLAPSTALAVEANSDLTATPERIETVEKTSSIVNNEKSTVQHGTLEINVFPPESSSSSSSSSPSASTHKVASSPCWTSAFPTEFETTTTCQTNHPNDKIAPNSLSPLGASPFQKAISMTSVAIQYDLLIKNYTETAPSYHQQEKIHFFPKQHNNSYRVNSPVNMTTDTR